MRALLGILLVVGCGGDDVSYIIVNVDKRPAVHGPTKLEVTLSNSGSMRTDSLDVGDSDFPLTFSISAPGRAGDLGISIDALDATGALVGRGTGTTPLTSMAASVTLDSADFVVNALYANNQFLSNDFEAVGLQLAATANNNWTVVFREDCTQCDILARRFDATGLPVRAELAAGDTQFPVNLMTMTTTSGSVPAVTGGSGASANTTLVAWDYFEGSEQGVACRTLTDQGAAASTQVKLAIELSDVVTAAPLSNGNFVVTWQSMSPSVIRSIIALPDCTKLTTAPFTVSQTSGLFGARRSHVASNGTAVLYTWVVDGEVRIRQAANNGTLLGSEAIIVPKTASMEVDHVRISPWGSGFALAVRWASMTSAGPGKIEVYRLTAAGVVMGTPVLITDRSGSDFASDKAFGVAQRPDQAVLVVWHMCETGPGSCDVFGRVLRPTGVPVGDEFVIPTSTGSDQVNPSVVALQESFVAAWNDSSGIAPDTSGTAVRARIVYPVYDDARGVIGATCGASAPGAPECNEGLACAMGSDNVQRCYATCTPPSCPGGGTCSTVDASTSACTF